MRHDLSFSGSGAPGDLGSVVLLAGVGEVGETDETEAVSLSALDNLGSWAMFWSAVEPCFGAAALPAPAFDALAAANSPPLPASRVSDSSRSCVWPGTRGLVVGALASPKLKVKRASRGVEALALASPPGLWSPSSAAVAASSASAAAPPMELVVVAERVTNGSSPDSDARTCPSAAQWRAERHSGTAACRWQQRKRKQMRRHHKQAQGSRTEGGSKVSGTEEEEEVAEREQGREGGRGGTIHRNGVYLVVPRRVH
jgi:hypothetical protein